MPLVDEKYYIGFFSVPHLAFMLILWTLGAFLAFYLPKKIGYSKKLIWICAILGLLCEFEKIVFFMQETPGGYRLPAEHIPINMCPLQVFFLFMLALAESPKKYSALISYMYPSMVGGGFIGMLIPSVIVLGYHGLLDLATYRYFFFHGMLIFLGLYLYRSRPIEYSIKNYVTSLAFVGMLVMLAIWINAFFGWDPTVNFWFIVRPPAENLPILNQNHGWVIYVIQLVWICLLLFTLCYLPVIIRYLSALIKRIRN